MWCGGQRKNIKTLSDLLETEFNGTMLKELLQILNLKTDILIRSSFQKIEILKKSLKSKT